MCRRVGWCMSHSFYPAGPVAVGEKQRESVGESAFVRSKSLVAARVVSCRVVVSSRGRGSPRFATVLRTSQRKCRRAIVCGGELRSVGGAFAGGVGAAAGKETHGVAAAAAAGEGPPLAAAFVHRRAVGRREAWPGGGVGHFVDDGAPGAASRGRSYDAGELPSERFGVVVVVVGALESSPLSLVRIEVVEAVGREEVVFLDAPGGGLLDLGRRRHGEGRRTQGELVGRGHDDALVVVIAALGPPLSTRPGRAPLRADHRPLLVEAEVLVRRRRLRRRHSF
mmetsp:Transcript_11192/g.36981  ORF Transcript_11192/g.36981 Transcript_11192/m.36981 type:complete len:281 (+) Transcript_11192:349-1191(+)